MQMFCLKCFSSNVKGQHNCGEKVQLQNIQSLVKPRSLEILASDILQQKSDNKENLTLQTRGRPNTYVKEDLALRKVIHKSQSIVSIETLKNAKLRSQTSQRAFLSIIQELRSDVSFQPGLRDALKSANEKFSDFFTVTDINISSSEGKNKFLDYDD